MRCGKRNKKPTSDNALRKKTSGTFCVIIAQIRKERKKISDMDDQHKQE